MANVMANETRLDETRQECPLSLLIQYWNNFSIGSYSQYNKGIKLYIQEVKNKA